MNCTTYVGLAAAVDNALRRAIESGKDSIVVFVRSGGQRRIRVTVKLDSGLKDAPTKFLVYEGVDR